MTRIKSIQAIGLLPGIKRYLVVLGTTLGLCLLYTFVAAPLIEGERQVLPNPTPRNSIYDPPNNNRAQLQPLFPAGSWELESGKTLDTEQGKILFQDYQVNDDGTWDVFPFTMILISEDQKKSSKSGAATRPPFVLRTHDRAQIRFNRPIELGAGGDGPKIELEQARLLGKVELYRYGQDEAVHVVTRNVQISDRRIFTMEDVAFQFGLHRGAGRNMSIELAHEGPRHAASRGFSSITGIHRIQLAQLDSLRLEPEPKTTADDKRMLAASRSPIQVTCDGSFEFDFDRQRAAFRKRVVVKQLDDFGDSLSCEQLDLLFQTTDAAETTPPSNKLLDSKYRLSEIVAAGTPAILDAPSQQAQAQGEYLRYNLQSNQIEARDNQSVRIRQAESEFVARHVEYQIRDDGSLGNLNAMGSGRMTRQATADKDGFAAAWQNHLTIRRADDRRQLVTLDGNAVIQLDQESEIRSANIQFWLWEIARVDATGKPDGWDYQPAQLVTDGDVVIRSPDLSGQAERLVATWPQNPLPVQPRAEKPTTRTTRTTTPFSELPVRRLAGYQPTDKTGAELIRQVGFVQAEPHRPPLQFVGEIVEVQLAGDQNTTQVTDLKIRRNVKVWQMARDDQNQTETREFEITGDLLHAIPQTGERYRIQVANSTSGGSANVLAQGMNMSGQNIFMDQAANRIWVDGPGQTKVDQDPTKRSDHQEADAKLQNVSQIQIGWQGGMIFDGHKVYFEHQVVSKTRSTMTDGNSTETQTNSAALSIELDRYVDLSKFSRQQQNDSPKQTSIKIRELLLIDRLPDQQRAFDSTGVYDDLDRSPEAVVLTNQKFDREGRLIERQTLVSPRARFDVYTGTLRAVGPGSISIHALNAGRQSTGSRLTPLGFGTRKGRTANQSAIVFVRVNFDVELRANAESKDMVVKGNTRTVYVPTSNLDQSYDPDSDQMPPEAVRITCQEIQLAQWMPEGSDQETSELIATGNARVVSEQFETIAHRLSYKEDMDTLTVEGSSRQDAVLWTRTDPRSKPNKLVAAKIRYRPSDGSARIDAIRSATLRGK